MKQAWKWAAAVAFAVGVTAAPASAEIIDFSVGPQGPQGTTTVFVGPIEVTSGWFNGGNFDTSSTQLYRRDVVGDRGLGVCSGDESCTGTNGEIVELDAEPPGFEELVRIALPTGFSWDSVLLSSLDGTEAGELWAGSALTPMNLILSYVATGSGGTAAEQQIAVPDEFKTSQYLFFRAVSTSGDTDHYVWGAEISAVPEPASLMLVGLGLLGLAASRRRS